MQSEPRVQTLTCSTVAISICKHELSDWSLESSESEASAEVPEACIASNDQKSAPPLAGIGSPWENEVARFELVLSVAVTGLNNSHTDGGLLYLLSLINSTTY